jgi:hypothetical protein
MDGDYLRDPEPIVNGADDRTLPIPDQIAHLRARQARDKALLDELTQMVIDDPSLRIGSGWTVSVSKWVRRNIAVSVAEKVLPKKYLDQIVNHVEITTVRTHARGGDTGRGSTTWR